MVSVLSTAINAQPTCFGRVGVAVGNSNNKTVVLVEKGP